MDWAIKGKPIEAGCGARLWPGLRKHWRLLATALGLALLGAALVGAFHTRRHAAVIVPYPHELAQVSFAVAGDVIPHGPVRAAAEAAGEGEQGWAALFSDVADVFHGADFGFVNLETPVAPEHSRGPKPSNSKRRLSCPRR